jgi:hypothetical protein
MMDLIPIGKEFSPKTSTLTETAIAADVIKIDTTDGEGIDAFPDVPTGRVGHVVLSETENYDSEDPSTYELAYYGTRDVVSGELRDVERGVAGIARTWPAGTTIASHITEDQINALAKIREFEDVDTSTLYNYKLKQEGGHVIFEYEEVT